MYVADDCSVGYGGEKSRSLKGWVKGFLAFVGLRYLIELESVNRMTVTLEPTVKGGGAIAGIPFGRIIIKPI